MAKAFIFINGVRVALATKYDIDETTDVPEMDTLGDGVYIQGDDDENTKYTVNISRIDTMSQYENQLNKAMKNKSNNGFPIVIQDGKLKITCMGVRRVSKKRSRDPNNPTSMDLSFKATKITEAYK